MAQKNMSDIIEAYLKNILKNNTTIEIKRSDVAERFDCVPSQINYVINTRFTQEHGYMVESKRGGGGYIRIFKIELIDEIDGINEMIKLVGDAISHKSALNIIETLVKHQVISSREAVVMASVLDTNFLVGLSKQEDQVRSLLMKQMLKQLRYTY